jgi:hypothetical protein
LDEEETRWTQPAIQFATTTPLIVQLQDEPEPEEEAGAQIGTVCIYIQLSTNDITCLICVEV